MPAISGAWTSHRAREVLRTDLVPILHDLGNLLAHAIWLFDVWWYLKVLWFVMLFFSNIVTYKIVWVVLDLPSPNRRTDSISRAAHIDSLKHFDPLLLKLGDVLLDHYFLLANALSCSLTLRVVVCHCHLVLGLLRIVTVCYASCALLISFQVLAEKRVSKLLLGYRSC